MTSSETPAVFLASDARARSREQRPLQRSGLLKVFKISRGVLNIYRLKVICYTLSSVLLLRLKNLVIS